MIQIREDRSYLSGLDLKAIENGFAELRVYSLRITNFLTEEQKQENSRISDTLDREQWSTRCEQNRKFISVKVESVVDLISENFMIYQYKDKNIDYGNDDWDLYFWSNYNDLSYVTLNTNQKRPREKEKETIDNVLDLVKKIDMDGIAVTVQYTAIYSDDLVNAVVLDYCKKQQGVFIEHGGQTGKIVKCGDKFYFKKKGAKKKMYYINNTAVLSNILNT